MQCLGEPRGKAGIRGDELLHLPWIAGDYDDVVISVILHRLKKGVQRLLAEVMGASGVLTRLFPWHVVDPGDVLLWANGPIELPGREHQERWRWHCAPLAEGDGAGR